MTDKNRLDKINKEIKVIINQSSFISLKIRNKIIKMLGEEFSIKLPIEKFKNIDITITDVGNIIMRDEEYKRDEKLDIDSICSLFDSFKEKADKILNKNEIDYYTKNDKSNFFNILILIVLVLVLVLLIKEVIFAFLVGNYFSCFWDLVIISCYLSPGIRTRFSDAINFIKRKMRRRK